MINGTLTLADENTVLRQQIELLEARMQSMFTLEQLNQAEQAILDEYENLKQALQGLSGGLEAHRQETAQTVNALRAELEHVGHKAALYDELLRAMPDEVITHETALGWITQRQEVEETLKSRLDAALVANEESRKAEEGERNHGDDGSD